MKLYKFVSLPVTEDTDSMQLKKFIDSILERRIYFSAMPWLNDPFDGTVILENLSEDEYQQAYSIKKDWAKDFDIPIVEPYIEKAPQNMLITNRILSTSFSKGTIFDDRTLYDENKKSISIRYSDLMWAYYANGHHGVCLEYEFDEMLDTIDFLDKGEQGTLQIVSITHPEDGISYMSDIKFRAQPVQYLEKPEPIEFIDGKCAKEYEVMPLFLRKSATWLLEQEYRIIAESPHRSAFPIADRSYFVQHKRNSLKSIRLGFKMSRQVRQTILDALKSENIAIYDTYLESDFTLQYKAIGDYQMLTPNA